MNGFRKVIKAILVSVLLFILTGASSIANASQINETNVSIKAHSLQTLSVKKVLIQPKETKVLQLTTIQAKASTAKIAVVKTTQIKKVTVATYKEFTYKKDMPKAVGIYLNNQQVAYFMETEGGFTPEQRAKVLVSRINQFISKKGDPKTVLPGFQDGFAIGRANKEPLFTADSKVAESLHITNAELARTWVNNIRTALGAPKFVRENQLIASRSGISASFSRKYFEPEQKMSGHEQFGVASWYGGFFNGRRAADGSRFNTHSFTAAHKTLPFGSVVKVTNLRNSKTCIVKITDRGPFIPGRIIDLSAAAAKEIGVFSSGISKVKVELLGRS